MRIKYLMALQLILTLCAGNAEASTYDLSLINSMGPSAGTGSLTVNGPVAGVGLTTFSQGSGGLTGLKFTIAGYDFSLDNSLMKASVTFENGVLAGVTYLGVMDGFKLDLGMLGLDYAFLDFLNPGLSSTGTISTSSGVSAAPLPPSWTLMLLGLAVVGFLFHRRNNRAQLALST